MPCSSVSILSFYPGRVNGFVGRFLILFAWGLILRVADLSRFVGSCPERFGQREWQATKTTTQALRLNGISTILISEFELKSLRAGLSRVLTP
jgi:hypothetical protein